MSVITATLSHTFHLWAVPTMCHNTAMAHTTEYERYDVHLGERGRLVLPAPVRERLALRDGDRLVLTVEPTGRMILVSLRDQVRKSQGLFRDVAPEVSLADELIRERREETAKEDKA